MPRRQNEEGKSKAVTPAAPAHTSTGRAPDPFIERIGSGYAERTFREQWTELEALLQAELTRARSSRDVGSEGLATLEDGEDDFRKTAAVMSLVFEELEAMDEFLRNAVPKILAGEKGETGIEYGQRVLRDHWSQLRGRLLADIAHLNSKCMYGRLPLPDGTSNMESITGDLKYHLGRADMLMKDFAFGNLEVMEGSLVTAGADFLAYRHHSAKRTAQKKGRSQPHTE